MDNNNQLISWTSKGASSGGVPSPEELEKTPCYPGIKRLRKGPVVVIECIQEIPCNPCEAACTFGAITIGASINNLPVLDEDKCTGCGICISSCPGLAIFVLDLNYDHESALISFPFEYFPLPMVGEEVQASDREGKEICKGKAVKIVDKPINGHTPVISISIPKKYALLVRGILIKQADSPTLNSTCDNNNNEDKMRISEHPILGRQDAEETVTITVDNKKMAAMEGEMILAALLGAGIRVNRFTSKYNQPRGLFCGIGQCTDCVMIVNGIPNVRTCVTPVKEGMVIETQYSRGKWGKS